MAAALLLAILTMLTYAGRAWFKREQPVPVAPLVQPADTIERTDLQQRATSMVEGARQPGADAPQFEVQVIQDKPRQ